ncbi:MAG: alpha/beta fold hydrolase [Phycisphaerae bacterium]
MLKLILSAIMICLCLLGGCIPSENGSYTTDARLAEGLVVVLPGIEGESPMNRNIRQGLIAAGIDHAIPIHRWGRPIPVFGPLINQMDVFGNRLAARRLARDIVDYQDAHPGKSIHLIGHSGGGGIAVFAAEALPKDRKVDGLILLSPSISTRYDLTKALGNTRKGIVNFYTPADFGLLVIGTTVAGNVDGWHGPAAGAGGFDPADEDDPKQQTAYRKLHQVAMEHVADQPLRAHSAATEADFVRRQVAPWVTESTWPAVPTILDENQQATSQKRLRQTASNG